MLKPQDDLDPSLVDHVGRAIDSLLQKIQAGQSEQDALQSVLLDHRTGESGRDRQLADSIRLILAVMNDRRVPGWVAKRR